MIEIKDVLITPNPVDAGALIFITIDVEEIITNHRWSDLGNMTWAQIKAKTWNEISVFRNPDHRQQSVIRSGDYISGDEINNTM